MSARNILMPVRTVAEWGGVHEWTVDAAAALIAAGNSVTFVGQGDVFAERARATGADFIEIDWDNPEGAKEKALEDFNYDLIFSHAPNARKLGLALKAETGSEHIVMIHGAYHDFMYEWSEQVDAFVAASPSLVHFVQRFGRVAPWKVSNLPNAAPEFVFDLPLIGLDEKLSDGVGHIVTASRLSRDKIVQIQAVEEAARAFAHLRQDVRWVIDVYGDGPLRGYYERRYAKLCREFSNLDVEFHGWTPPDEIPRLMNRAVAAVAAGMAGMRACAAGTLCIGVGARDSVGVQIGNNLRAGVWSNFGDHGILRFEHAPIGEDIRMILDSDNYEDVIETARRVIRNGNSQSQIDEMMLAALQC